uniref:Uncharacterized protein n=1 Tax=Salix viminalis TaxID=40686 RepID=A0A6N2MAP2_SALVM
MGSWINSLAYQLLTQEAVEAENEIFFIIGDLATFNRRAEVVHPAETAALPTAEETRFLGQHIFHLDGTGEEINSEMRGFVLRNSSFIYFPVA